MRYKENAVLLGALCLASLAAPAAAQDAQRGASRVIEDVTRCRGIADPTARLACFDQAAASLANASENREIVVLDREEVRRTRRSLFGFSLPRLPFFGGGREDGDEQGGARQTADADEVSEIESTIASVATAGYGKWTLGLADGSTWQTTELNRSIEPHRGDTIHIERAAFGSYRASIGGSRLVRIRRVG